MVGAESFLGRREADQGASGGTLPSLAPVPGGLGVPLRRGATAEAPGDARPEARREVEQEEVAAVGRARGVASTVGRANDRAVGSR